MAGGPTLNEAVSLHQAGRLDEAKDLYRDILARDPQNANALHLSGALALQQDKPADAIDLIGRALAIVPDDPFFLGNFATALLETGQIDDAIDGFRKALAIDPGHLDARYNLGNALRTRGDLAGAAAEFEQVANREPAHLPAINNLALCMAELGRPNEAAEILQHVLDRAPDDPQTHTNLGRLLQQLRRADDAIVHYDAALAAVPGNLNMLNGRAAALIDAARLDDAQAVIEAILRQAPDDLDALLNLANLHVKNEQFDSAEGVYRRLLQHDAENASAWNNLGNLLWKLYRYDEADDAIRRALALRPDHPETLHNYAGCLVASGQLEAAQTVFDKAVPLAPHIPELTFDRGILALATGRFGEGFRDYRARPNIQPSIGRLYRDALPADLTGQTIDVKADQGLGDEIFFLRFLPQLKARGAQTCYRGDARLIPMLRRAAVADRILPANTGDGHSAAAITIAVGDLPYALGMANADSPPGSITLPPDPARVSNLREQLAAAGPPPYIGITWRAGTQGRRGLIFKQAPLESIAGAVKGTTATFVALQRLPQDGELARFADSLGAPLHDFTALNDDLEAMLALSGLLDEYVCVSNTNVHLRVAQGKGCRVLVPHPPEFRWMYDGRKSPWFRDTLIYRQERDGDWQPALAQLADDLKNI